MKIGIYIWHPKNEKRYCIGEWNPSKKQYIGMSEKEGAKFRIKQEIKSKTGTSKYELSDIIIDSCKIYDFYNPDNRPSGFDKLIHSNLRNYFGNEVQLSFENNQRSEFFELKNYKNQLSIFKNAVEKTAKNDWKNFDPERPFSFGPRKGSQDEAIEAIKNCKSKKFLLGAKCRFGKTFTSYEAMKERKAEKVLIMTFRPSDTKNAWREDLNTHQDFKSYTFYNQDQIEEFRQEIGNKVLFISFQKVNKSLKDNPQLYEDLKNENFDMIIVDEDQIGAHRKENRDLVENLKSDFLLVVTGTPELEFISNEFGDNFYKFDYIDEQKLKEYYENTKDKDYEDYRVMPKLELYSFDLSNKFSNTFTDLNGFQISKFFEIENDKFVHSAYIKKLLDYLSMTNDSAEKLDEAFGIFCSERNLNHGLWKLPSIKSCKLLKEILNNHSFFKDFHVEVLPESDKSPAQIEKICKENGRTIWLTVMKNTVGVTVKSWTYTISLYGSGDSTLTSYIQYIFRAGSPGKDVFYSFDFCPKRVLSVADNFAEAHSAGNKKSDYDNSIREVLNYLPIFAYKDSGTWNKLELNDFFKNMSRYTSERSCVSLLYEEFELLKDFEEIKNFEKLSKVLIAKNDALKSLKVEIEKKEFKKSSEKKELSNKDFVERAYNAFMNIYTWIKYSKDSINDVDDFINKIKSFKDDYLGWLGFSEEFINSLIQIMEISKKRFNIVIQKFAHFKFSFNREDVPQELAERMIKKFSDNKGSICDFYCQGPTLLKLAKNYGFKELYARIPNNDKRLEFIIKKELIDVNIIKEEDMHFDKIIMNPPYNGNLHLKILQEAMKHGDEIVNLSPIRWLQDPLAEYKKNSDWKKFEDIRKRIKNLEVVPMKYAMTLFSVDFPMDIGIYHITENGNFDVSTLVNQLLKKVLLKMPTAKNFDKNQKDGWRVKISVAGGGKNGGGGAGRKIDLASQKLICFKDGMKDGKPWYDFYGKNQFSRCTPEIHWSILFDSEDEANNWIAVQYTNLGKWIYNEMTMDMAIRPSNFLWLPTYTHPWTDKDLYEYFGLTEDEIKEIECSIKL